MRNRCALLLTALLSTGCATPAPDLSGQPGCRMLPLGGYTDSRITAPRLEQGRGGCRFEAVANSAAAAHSQASLLIALATQRCGEVMVTDESEPLAGGESDMQPVRMRLSLTQSVPHERCVFGAAPAPETGPENNDVSIYSTRMDPPRYPPSAYREGRQGQAVLILLIDDQNRTLGAVLERSSGHADLDEAAVKAAQGWTFGVRGKQPDISRVRVPVNFALNQAAT